MKDFDSLRMPEVNIDGDYFEQGFDTFLYRPFKVLFPSQLRDVPAPLTFRRSLHRR